MSQLKVKEPSRLVHDEAVLRDAILEKLTYELGKTPEHARAQDWFQATALAVRDRIVDVWMRAQAETSGERKKRVYYLSIEFLIGRLLLDALTNLRLVGPARRALADLNVDFDDVSAAEPDAALGNGGLGRLAACFMDSMAALAIPAYGYGIRYENGLFEQRIHDGWQHEMPEDWLASGNPWEFRRNEPEYTIGFGGAVEYLGGDEATPRANWYPDERVLARAFDTPIAGWRGRHVNALRLWSARAASPIQLAAFNKGDYVGAVAARTRAEAISRVLYPNDATAEGQELRLRQEYFFTAASLQDILRRHLDAHDTLDTLPDFAAVQLNDTHPAIAVAELMRLLVDEHEYAWRDAWRITKATLNYTNHTLLPEALETWSVELFGRLLPRHLQVIYLINWEHLQATGARRFADPAFLASVSLIRENGDRRVRMGHLAFLGANTVNGVSALHTTLLRETVFNDLAKTTPTRIVNKTNGISFRRWLYEANAPLTKLLTDTVGERVLDDPSVLRDIERFARDPRFVERYRHARLGKKAALASYVRSSTGIHIDPHALFDVHIKRIHEYKRQLLNILETIALWQDMRAHPNADHVPRVKLFAGKAAPSYTRAKLIIKLANDVGRAVNNDAAINGKLKVVFVPNYSASLAEKIVPSADVSEQISTAGMEASGTGNMKLALNGALTIGTLDGANVEIREQVGEENVMIFGLTASEVARRVDERFEGSTAVASSARLAAVVRSLAAGTFSPDDPERYAPLVQSLLEYDRYMVAADFDAYWDAQRKLDRLWLNEPDWWEKAILNTARTGWFSSDRTIREYARDIWNIEVG